jgi:hypothetical protein
MPDNLFLIFLERLNTSGIPYMVTGSVASIIYGEPRMTNDIDLVAALKAENVYDLLHVFGADQFYCPPQEVMRTEIARETGGHFNIIHHETGFKADIYPIGHDALHTWAMTRRRKVIIEQSEIWIAPPEYVILRKLQYYKEGGSQKHLRDIKKMIELSEEIIDKPLLQQMVIERDLLNQWQTMQTSDF